MKNFRFVVEVTANPTGKSEEAVVIKTLKHTIRDDSLLDFSRLAVHIPLDGVQLFNGVDISHILKDARATIANAGAIRYSVESPEIGEEFKYIDTLVTAKGQFDIMVRIYLADIDDVGGEVTDTYQPEDSFVALMLDHFKKRIAPLSSSDLLSYHVIGKLSRDAGCRDNQLRMTLYRPTVPTTYIRDLDATVDAPALEDNENIVFQLTGDRGWRVVNRHEGDEFCDLIKEHKLAGIASIVLPLYYVKEKVTKEDYEKRF